MASAYDLPITDAEASALTKVVEKVRARFGEKTKTGIIPMSEMVYSEAYWHVVIMGIPVATATKWFQNRLDWT
jgi:hypothetical protein